MNKIRKGVFALSSVLALTLSATAGPVGGREARRMHG